MNDVVIVGARPAGAMTALLLARAGLRVTVLDRSRFPSDTLSTHAIQVPGVAALARAGLAGKIEATGCPPVRSVTFDPGVAVLRGEFPAEPDADHAFAPRRTVLDALLLNAAADAGADVVTGVDVHQLRTDGDRVTGVRARTRGSGPARDFAARMVIGADGKHSFVARTVTAPVTQRRPATSGALYTYWTGLEAGGASMYTRDGLVVGVWATNDGAVVTYLGVPASAFAALHADPDAGVLAAFDRCGELGVRARAATRVALYRGTTDLPNVVRRPHGPGWALVGDAGLVMDPVTGQGIGHALRDAESLAAAIVTGFGDGRLERALAEHHATRDRRTLPAWKFATRLASFRPDRSGPVLFRALAAQPDRINQFLGVLSGSVPMAAFSRQVPRIIGLRGLAAIAARRMGLSSRLPSDRSPAKRRPDRMARTEDQVNRNVQ